LVNAPTVIKGTKKSKSAPAPVGAKVILLVEDSPDDAFFFLELFRSSQILNPVMVVHDGEEAIAYMKREGQFADAKAYPPPSALFLDLSMPKVTGLEVLRWVKTQPQLKDMLVVILTHYQEVADLNQAYTLGAHSFLTKPLTPRELNNLMTHFQPYFYGSAPQPPPGTQPEPAA
jgi:CheY-like chemotaxis protein